MTKKRKKKRHLENKIFAFYNFYNKLSNSKVDTISISDEFRLKQNIKISSGNRVSDFTDWIYESTVGYKDEQKLRFGKSNEKKILERYIQRNPDTSIPYFKNKYSFEDEWILEFQDLENNNDFSFKISDLRINDSCFFGRPDLVFRNNSTNDRIIIEVKTTFVPDWKLSLNKFKWYNLHCQLWSYSFIDDFKNSPNIFLIGDIWSKTKWQIKDHETPLFWRIKKDGLLNLENKAVNKFHNQCKDIFNIYGGKFYEDQ
jgi:hypothetical protein